MPHILSEQLAVKQHEHGHFKCSLFFVETFLSFWLYNLNEKCPVVCFCEIIRRPVLRKALF